MRKLKGLIAGIILCFGLLILSACGGKSSGITSKDVDMKVSSINKDSATIKITFTENENISKKLATFYVVAYKYVDGSEETSGNRQDVSFSGDVFTSATVSFSSLASDQEYHFVLFITFEKSTKRLTFVEGTTSTYVSEEIKSTEDFKNNLVNDTDGDFILTDDLDFSNEVLSLFSSEAKAFKGKLDGGIYDDQGNLTGCHKISNFKIASTGTYNGLFGYLKGAEVTNLIIENVSVESTNKTTSHIGAFAGYAIDSYVENITVNNVSFSITTSSGSSTSEINTGGVIGYTKRSSYKDVVADNVVLDFSSIRTRVNLGLFAGKIAGDALKDNVTAKNCGVNGKLVVTSDFTASSTETAYIYAGGFVGSLNSSGAIEDCYAEVESVYSTKRQECRTFDLFFGGLVGANGPDSTMMYIKNSLAVLKDVQVYAGQTSTEEGYDYSQYDEAYLATGYAHVGGFIGKANGAFRGIFDSYVLNAKDLVLHAATSRDIKEDGAVVGVEDALFVNSFVGRYTGTDMNTYLPSCNDHILTPTSGSAPSALNETLAAIVEKYLIA